MSRKYRSGRYRFVRTDAAIQAVLKTLTETNDAQPNQVVPRGRSNPWGFSGRTFGRIMKGIGFRAYVVRRYQKLSERNVESRLSFCREILLKPPRPGGDWLQNHRGRAWIWNDQHWQHLLSQLHLAGK